MNHFHEKIDRILTTHANCYRESKRATLIEHTLTHREALTTQSGSLARWTPQASTGRSPQDTYIVRHPESEQTIDWTSANNNALSPEVFDVLFNEAYAHLERAERIYAINRVLGARVAYALPLQVITTHAFCALFTDTMFRAVPPEISKSMFAGNGFQMIVLPFKKIDGSTHEKGLRRKDGTLSSMVIAIDIDRQTCLVIGSQYCGTIKKTLFTVMNYLLPEKGILPLHSSAAIDEKGSTVLMLGLSGTGKTTLSNNPRLLFIGDDEHGWSEEGVANFENGCYAKLIHLDQSKEPEIYYALFENRPVLENGCLVENAMVYPDGSFDFDDDRYTENSRGSFPISFLSRKKDDGHGGHPRTILFLTADAHGVLPPIAKLTKELALFWFLMGYTCKLAGTETGITAPVTTFSRFFGQPFMPRQPMDYIALFEHYLDQYQPHVYLVNTGWSGGPYGVGKRMDIRFTRALVDAALSGSLETTEYTADQRFHILIPRAVPGVDPHMLDPRATWKNQEEYDTRACALAQECIAYFDKTFSHTITDQRIRGACPSILTFTKTEA